MPSQVIGSVDLTPATGRASMNINQGWVRFYNHSIAGITITLSDGQEFYIPPQKRRTICVQQAVGSFTWMRPLVINLSPSTALSSFMVIETLDPVDVRLENDLHDLGGAANVGNTLPIVTAQKLQDDSDVAGTTFIESSIAAVQHWNGTVEGGLTLSQIASAVFEIIKSLAGGAQTFSEWSAPDKKTLQLNQDINGTWHWFDVTDNVDLITMNSGGQTFDNNAMTTDGLGNLAVKSLKGASGGKLKAISQFSGTGTALGTAHGLGTTPTAVFVQNSSGVGAALSWGNPTSTTVDIHENDMGSVAWVAIALAF